MTAGHRMNMVEIVEIRNLAKNFTLLSINHDLYLVDSKTGVHTNGVEDNWCVAKAPVKQTRGISRDYLKHI